MFCYNLIMNVSSFYHYLLQKPVRRVRDTKTILVLLSLPPLVRAGFCIYQVETEETTGITLAKNECQGPSEKEYKD